MVVQVQLGPFFAAGWLFSISIFCFSVKAPRCAQRQCLALLGLGVAWEGPGSHSGHLESADDSPELFLQPLHMGWMVAGGRSGSIPCQTEEVRIQPAGSSVQGRGGSEAMGGGGNMGLGGCGDPSQGLPQNQVRDPNASRASNQRTRRGKAHVG